MRTPRSFLALSLAVLAMAAAPRSARAETKPDSTAVAKDSAPMFERSVPVLAFELAVPAPSAESIHVYLLTQLVVSEQLGRDSVAVAMLIRHAVMTLVTALNAERIQVARGMVFVRDASASGTGSGPSSSLTRPPNRLARVTMLTADAGRSDRRARLRFAHEL